MRRILLELCYEGTNFCGWQIQPNGRSVQQTLMNALFMVFGVKIDVTGVSRTDSGVHAQQYFCHLDIINDAFDISKLCPALNFHLPDSVSALSSCVVDNDFHARYNAVSKTYSFRILNREARSPFCDRHTIHFKQRLDVEAMQKAALHFVGKHDFASFMSAKSSTKENCTERTVFFLNIYEKDDIIVIDISADGFLYNMVRIISGTLFFVGVGKIKHDDVPTIITSKNRGMAGPTLPAKGLTLEKVFY